jgi:hypothetical protein
MGQTPHTPQWHVSALLRILPFIGFLTGVFQILSRGSVDTAGILIVLVLGVASIATWFVWYPKSHNGN